MTDQPTICPNGHSDDNAALHDKSPVDVTWKCVVCGEIITVPSFLDAVDDEDAKGTAAWHNGHPDTPLGSLTKGSSTQEEAQ